jgi:hypothetical protein
MPSPRLHYFRTFTVSDRNPLISRRHMLGISGEQVGTGLSVARDMGRAQPGRRDAIWKFAVWF